MLKGWKVRFTADYRRRLQHFKWSKHIKGHFTNQSGSETGKLRTFSLNFYKSDEFCDY